MSRDRRGTRRENLGTRYLIKMIRKHSRLLRSRSRDKPRSYRDGVPAAKKKPAATAGFFQQVSDTLK